MPSDTTHATGDATMTSFEGVRTADVNGAALAYCEQGDCAALGQARRFVPLRLAEAASANLGWPLHVIDDVGQVPHIERPDAFLQALSEIEPVSSGRRMVRP
jgi:hypothetical protein